jgi:hypothetical protein
VLNGFYNNILEEYRNDLFKKYKDITGNITSLSSSIEKKPVEKQVVVAPLEADQVVSVAPVIGVPFRFHWKSKP